MNEGVNHKSSASGGGSVINMWRRAYVTVIVTDFVRTCRNRSQYSQIRGVLNVVPVVTGHGQVVAVRVYRVWCCVVVGRG